MKKLQVISDSNLLQISKDFDALIRAKNLSIRGKGMYQACVNEFLFWLQAKKVSDSNKITSKIMIDYYEYITNRSHKRRPSKLSESSINLHLFSLRLLIKYLNAAGLMKNSITIPGIFRGIPYERETLGQDEIKEAFKNCSNLREKVLLIMAYGCGLRRSEIEQLNCNDIFLNQEYMVVKRGKNGKRRDIALNTKFTEAIRSYIYQERSSYSTPDTLFESALIINNKGKPMRGEQMNSILKQILLRTENPCILRKNITLHCLRHSLAVHLLENGANLEFIRELLGHSSIDTTYLYARKNKLKYKQLK